MTKEQEAQQAQTIARIKQEYERHSGRTYHAFTDFAPLVTEFYANLSVLLEIVDSQVQTIAEQAKEIERLKSGGPIKPGSYRRLIRNLRNAKPRHQNKQQTTNNKQQTAKRGLDH